MSNVDGLPMLARALASLLPILALLPLMARPSSSSTDAVVVIQPDDPSFDSWLHLMAITSSPFDIQPKRFNGRGGHHHRNTNRKLSETSSAAAAARRRLDEPARKPRIIVVSQRGRGNFRTIQAAVDSIPLTNSQRVIIKIRPGIYREKVHVEADWVTFRGYGVNTTVVEWNDTASTIGANGNPLGTFGSATVAVNGDHFTARQISFKNTAPAPAGGEVGKQAVALRISGDFGAFLNVNFYGAQDTLYDHKGRHLFHRCRIVGSIDMIFGDGRSFYRQCELQSIATPDGSLTAQKRANMSEDTGFAFYKCNVTGSGSIYLGRAWGPASRVVYSFTHFDDIILPAGWFDWDDAARQATVFYGEYRCSGPGANTQGRVPWSRVLNSTQASPFTHTGFVNGELWLNDV